ncbi:MAG: hypothetical protein KQJ78_23015 [Deltaproteobacteria bacterium]|nr:hypothetical protein [Deltaproteobacteria bacterium]
MKQLQIFKTAPAPHTQFLSEKLGEGKEVTKFELFANPDYDELVKQIFEHEDIISWW